MGTMAKNIKAIVSMLVFSTCHGEGKEVLRRRNKQTKRTSPLQFTIDVFDEYLNISFSSCRLQNNEEFPWKCTITKTAQDLNVMMLAVFSLIFFATSSFSELDGRGIGQWGGKLLTCVEYNSFIQYPLRHDA